MGWWKEGVNPGAGGLMRGSFWAAGSGAARRMGDGRGQVDKVGGMGGMACGVVRWRACSEGR